MKLFLSSILILIFTISRITYGQNNDKWKDVELKTDPMVIKITPNESKTLAKQKISSIRVLEIKKEILEKLFDEGEALGKRFYSIKVQTGDIDGTLLGFNVNFKWKKLEISSRASLLIPPKRKGYSIISIKWPVKVPLIQPDSITFSDFKYK